MKEPEMKACPLLSAGKYDPACCMENGCAWWHAYNRSEKIRTGCCALVSIAEHLADMNVLGIECHND